MNRTRKTKTLIILTGLLVLAMMTVIFCFSAENAEQSTEQSGKVVDIVIDVAVPDFDRKPVAEQQSILSKASHLVRKGGHFTEFSALGFFLMLHVFAAGRRDETKAPGGSGRKSRRFRWLWALIPGVLYAASDEIHQIFSDGRGPSVLDVLLDSSGVIFGILVASAIVQLIRRGRKSSSG